MRCGVKVGEVQVDLLIVSATGNEGGKTYEKQLRSFLLIVALGLTPSAAKAEECVEGYHDNYRHSKNYRGGKS